MLSRWSSARTARSRIVINVKSHVAYKAARKAAIATDGYLPTMRERSRQRASKRLARPTNTAFCTCQAATKRWREALLAYRHHSSKELK